MHFERRVPLESIIHYVGNDRRHTHGSYENTQLWRFVNGRRLIVVFLVILNNSVFLMKGLRDGAVSTMPDVVFKKPEIDTRIQKLDLKSSK